MPTVIIDGQPKRRHPGAALYQDHLKTALEYLDSARLAQNPGAALRPEALANARLLEQSLHSGEGDIRGWLVLGWVHFYRIRAQHPGPCPDDWLKATTAFAHCFIADVGPLPELLLPVVLDMVVFNATPLLREADRSTISTVVQVWHRIVECTGPDDSHRSHRQSQLGTAHYRKFELLGEPADLEAANAFAEIAVSTATADHSLPAEFIYNAGSFRWERYILSQDDADLDQAVHYMQRAIAGGLPKTGFLVHALVKFAVALQERYQRRSNLADLDQAITVLEQTTQLPPAEDPQYRRAPAILSAVLLTRFRHTSAPADLKAALAGARTAVDQAARNSTPDPILLAALGEALVVAFGSTGDPKCLDEAVRRLRQAIHPVQDDDPLVSGYLSNLAAAHRVRFDQAGHPKDIRKAISLGRHAVRVAPPDSSMLRGCLSNLGLALQSSFEAYGATQDMDDAVVVLRRALEMPPSKYSERPDALSNYGGALQVRFRLTARAADLDAAIEALQEAVDLAPQSHAERPTYLTNLCVALSARFRSAGAVADLEAAIGFGQTAVETTVEGHPDRPRYLSNAALTRGDRFRRSGALADLDAAISYGAQAVAATPKKHPDQALYLSNLGGALQARFWRTDAEADLDEAIKVNTQAARHLPGNRPDRGLFLSSYAMSLAARYERTGNSSDAENAIKLLHEALDVTPIGNPDRAGFISNLGGVLRARFARTDDLADIQAAIDTGRQAVAAAEADQPQLTVVLANLGVSLNTWFSATGQGKEAAVSAFEAALMITSGAPSTRIHAARNAAALLADSEPQRAAELLSAAVRLLPMVTERWLRRNDRQYELGGLAGLAGDAAALLLAAPPSESDPLPESDTRGAAEQALVVLESGRAVLLGQALETRTDLTDLRRDHPELAERFVQLIDVLDSDVQSPLANSAPADSHATPQPPDRHRAALQLAELIDRIRSLDGSANFLLQPTVEDLIEETRTGPVVLFNVSRYGSDAIVVTKDGASSIHLEGLDGESLTIRVNAFYTALATAGDPQATPLTRIRAQHDVSATLEWLWDVAAEPVLANLGLDSPPIPDASVPRIWWLPGGLLGLLPIHAAGYHREPTDVRGSRTVLDRVISSYAPSMRSLRHARRPARGASSAERRSVIVAMPVTPGLTEGAPLRKAVAEAEMVSRRLPSPHSFVAAGTSDSEAGVDIANIPTKEKVLAALEDCSFVHFACHGITDRNDPSQSRLLLSDHQSDPLTVASLARIDLDSAHLAYLSACSTAASTKADLMDEAIQLGSAFQLAGFRHVIGTLWEIDDAVAEKAAVSFYDALGDDSVEPDAARSAEALHRTVHMLRNQYRATPTLWAAYVHIGA